MWYYLAIYTPERFCGCTVYWLCQSWQQEMWLMYNLAASKDSDSFGDPAEIGLIIRWDALPDVKHFVLGEFVQGDKQHAVLPVDLSTCCIFVLIHLITLSVLYFRKHMQRISDELSSARQAFINTWFIEIVLLLCGEASELPWKHSGPQNKGVNELNELNIKWTKDTNVINIYTNIKI